MEKLNEYPLQYRLAIRRLYKIKRKQSEGQRETVRTYCIILLSAVDRGDMLATQIR